MNDEGWPLILLGMRIAVAACLYLFLLTALRALRAELRARTTPVTAPSRLEVAPPPRPRAAPSASPMLARANDRLEVIAYDLSDGTTSELVGRSYPLDGPAVIGRGAASTVLLPEPHVSGRHARLLPADGAWWVEDLGSTNGTFVNARRVERPTRLGASGEVRFGPIVARVVRGAEEDDGVRRSTTTAPRPAASSRQPRRRR